MSYSMNYIYAVCSVYSLAVYNIQYVERYNNISNGSELGHSVNCLRYIVRF